MAPSRIHCTIIFVLACAVLEAAVSSAGEPGPMRTILKAMWVLLRTTCAVQPTNRSRGVWKAIVTEGTDVLYAMRARRGRQTFADAKLSMQLNSHAACYGFVCNHKNIMNKGCIVLQLLVKVVQPASVPKGMFLFAARMATHTATGAWHTA